MRKYPLRHPLNAAVKEVIMPTRHNDTAVPHRTNLPQQKTVTTRDLMGGARELIIMHAEAQYLLRITSNGKLILTK